MTPEEKLTSLGLVLPDAPVPVAITFLTVLLAISLYLGPRAQAGRWHLSARPPRS